MSFSGKVKEELSRQIPAARHCRLAELLAILLFAGAVSGETDGAVSIRLQTENELVRRKCFTLLRKTFNMGIVSFDTENPDARSVFLAGDETAKRILEALHWDAKTSIHGECLRKTCCRRAFLRGAFLAAGSISNPDRFYHFEIVADSAEKAELLIQIMRSFEVESKCVERKGRLVVYVKEGNQIVELLGLMEAGLSLMELENIRILRDMRGNVNRKVNCETANLNKTVNAAVRQLDDIRIIQEKYGIDNLPAPLKEIAEARISDMDASLVEIGEMMKPPIGKSGVNHRFRKLHEIAESLKASKEG